MKKFTLKAVVIGAFVVVGLLLVLVTLKHAEARAFHRDLEKCLALCDKSGEGEHVAGGCYHLCPESLQRFEEMIARGKDINKKEDQ